MKLLVKAFASTAVLCLLTVLVSYMNNELSTHRDLSDIFKQTVPIAEPLELLSKEKPIHRFVNQDLAYKILNRLDLFEPLEEHIYIRTKGLKHKYNKVFLGLKHDDDYCTKHRAYVVEYPETIFEQVNFFIEETNSSFVRSKVLKPLGNDTHPHLGSAMPMKKKNTEMYDLMPHVNVFFTKNDMFAYMKVGKHYSCLTQMANHIPGHGHLASKDLVAEAVIRYAHNFETRPQCFSYDKFFPQTWLLYKQEQCQEFFQKLNSEEYKKLKEERRIVYIRKLGRESHRGEGVQPVDDDEETALKTLYDNGNKCGEVAKIQLVQHYIHNPLLLDGHKFDFRIYMLIASTNPLIAYYHDGFLRVTLASYDINSNEKKVLLTNLALNKQIYDDVKDGKLYEGKDEESLKQAQQWSYDRLQTYLLETGVISDPEWLNNYLRPEFKKAMIHLLRLSSHTFLRRSSVFELFGVDFMLDSNLNLWFIEANAGPAFKGYSQPMEKFILRMLGDHLEIVTGLLKSRMKRIVNYVNMLVETKQALKGKGGQAWIQDVKLKREEFKNITKNYFEEEFKPKSTNGFSKIVDEWYNGVEMYQGLVEEECL